MGVCVPNFRSVSFFVWPGDVTHINKYTNTQIYASEFKNILDRLLTPHEFGYLKSGAARVFAAGDK